MHVPVEPITRARSKKIKEALNGLIQDIWTDSTTGHSKLGPKEDEGVINLIQANDENQQAPLKDPLHVPVGPITRARSKKIKEALNGLIQDIWANSTTGHSKLSPKEDEGVINLIQVIDRADHA